MRETVAPGPDGIGTVARVSAPDAEATTTLLAQAERDCFASAFFTGPVYRRVNGVEVA